MSFINRELSWLEFNQRVLDQGNRESLPLLERLKFLAITASNLDEFFQVRVGGLHLMRVSGSHKRGISGLTPSQQLTAVRTRAKVMIEDQYNLLNKELLPALQQEGLQLLDTSAISPSQHEALSSRFQDSIFPLLTPLAYDEDTSMANLPAMRIILACELESLSENSTRTVFIPLPDGISRFIQLPTSEVAGSTPHQNVILTEDLISAFSGELFPDEKNHRHDALQNHSQW